ncbi:heavy-metal-associated domain-containing protein [Corynebacterium caspium]|uniref:heavy-metal-associated domain-containing protein n=1 Tax=Corynebacterium caspium TaxID=234828 RepID=UPI000382AB4B|nr:heavy-metal-associated domain-containing protein [Corynebacterium caspium]WKD59431.1 Copper chaperone CopZ [Corynebacterium caspium DSM 44850]
MAQYTYNVTGMTCGHCEGAVREEISEIAGVTAVSADHKTGLVTVDTEKEIATADIIAAIKEAGYEAVPTA